MSETKVKLLSTEYHFSSCKSKVLMELHKVIMRWPKENTTECIIHFLMNGKHAADPNWPNASHNSWHTFCARPVNRTTPNFEVLRRRKLHTHQYNKPLTRSFYYVAIVLIAECEKFNSAEKNNVLWISRSSLLCDTLKKLSNIWCVDGNWYEPGRFCIICWALMAT